VSLEPEDIERAVRVLEAIVEDRSVLAPVDAELERRLLVAAGRASRPERDEQRVLARARRRKRQRDLRAEDQSRLDQAGIRKLRQQPIFATPRPSALAADATSTAGAAGTAVPHEEGPELNAPRCCYVCKRSFERVHFFYDQMCKACGDFNYRKRSNTADLRGRVAYISGARVKIGYQASILLLRAGARVIVSTRFPRDAARRYAAEPDHGEWSERLQIYGLDLRHTPSVEAFARHLVAHEERLDFVLHNACQTVRRPPGFYAHLMETESEPLAVLPEDARGWLAAHEALRAENAAKRLAPVAEATSPMAAVGLYEAPGLSQVALAPEDFDAGSHLFPSGQLDADLQQVDLRAINSWRLALDQVSTVELLEVQLVNAVAPFVLNARLKPLMLRHRTGDKHIVNVSAMEGQFYRAFKTDKHPHTNMAKAALNMMTRTAAADYVKDGIHMNSVDTGWVTDEDPAHIAARKTEEHGFHPPLDIVDGAARIVDPIFDGINTGNHVWGQFLKDYKPTPW